MILKVVLINDFGATTGRINKPDQTRRISTTRRMNTQKCARRRPAINVILLAAQQS